MKTIIFGDIHGKWLKVNNIVNYELSNDEISFTTGDLGNYKYEPKNNQKLVICHGNHESFEYIKELQNEISNNLKALNPGEIYRLPDDTTVTALPGVFSPNKYDSNESTKFYSKFDIEKILNIKEKIDILITHEAPLGIGIEKNEKDMGKEHVNQIIEYLKPKIAFFGHHHYLHQASIGDTEVIGLDYPNRSYLILDTNNFKYEIMKGQMKDKLGYKYDWED
ncbi:metallophosphoesterase [Nanoarchaeota archaeon]